MKERPILFSAPMVRAILDGRKTQTRRIFKLPKDHRWENYDNGLCVYEGNQIHYGIDELTCHYGQPQNGDRLWVRETFAPAADQWGAYEKWNDKFCSVKGDKPDIFYSADFKSYENDLGFTVSKPFIEKWRPSIHMPRWASRINLEITGVRVERLNDISEQDAIAEGIEPKLTGWKSYEDDDFFACPINSFESLWESINGDPIIQRDDDGNEISRTWINWAANPWVWVVEFKPVVKP